MNRRTFLQAGVLSPLGLGLGDSLWLRSQARAEAGGGKANACILLFMTGGPAQQETFDPKPDAPADIRGEFRPIAFLDRRIEGVAVDVSDGKALELRMVHEAKRTAVRASFAPGSTPFAAVAAERAHLTAKPHTIRCRTLGRKAQAGTHRRYASSRVW